MATWPGSTEIFLATYFVVAGFSFFSAQPRPGRSFLVAALLALPPTFVLSVWVMSFVMGTQELILTEAVLPYLFVPALVLIAVALGANVVPPDARPLALLFFGPIAGLGVVILIFSRPDPPIPMIVAGATAFAILVSLGLALARLRTGPRFSSNGIKILGVCLAVLLLPSGFFSFFVIGYEARVEQPLIYDLTVVGPQDGFRISVPFLCMGREYTGREPTASSRLVLAELVNRMPVEPPSVYFGNDGRTIEIDQSGAHQTLARVDYIGTIRSPSSGDFVLCESNMTVVDSSGPVNVTLGIQVGRIAAEGQCYSHGNYRLELPPRPGAYRIEGLRSVNQLTTICS